MCRRTTKRLICLSNEALLSFAGKKYARPDTTGSAPAYYFSDCFFAVSIPASPLDGSVLNLQAPSSQLPSNAAWQHSIFWDLQEFQPSSSVIKALLKIDTSSVSYDLPSGRRDPVLRRPYDRAGFCPTFSNSGKSLG